MSREDLEFEVIRLRGLLARAGINPHHADSVEASASPGRLSDTNSSEDDHSLRLALDDVLERFRHAESENKEATWDWDLISNRVLWNAALETFYGHKPDVVEPTGEWWIEHIHPLDRERVSRSIHSLIDGSGAAWMEAYRFRLVDGTYADVLDRGHVVRDTSGVATRMVGAMLDLTSLRASESALRKSEERFRTIVDTIETAFAVVEVKFDAEDHPIDYRFVHVNPAFERQAGVNLSGEWVRSYAPDLEEFWFETYGRVAKTREPANFESYARHFERWFDVRAVPVGDPSERQIGIFFNDTTERRRSQERLLVSESVARENSQRIQLALEAGAIIGTWNWDLPTDQFAVDEAFASAFGLDPALGRVGISLQQVIATVHPEDKQGLVEAINEVIGRGGRYAHQYRVFGVHGDYRWVEANGRVDIAPDGTPKSFPGVLIDVQERRAVQAERDQAAAALKALSETLEQQVEQRTAELFQAEEKLRQSQKMEAVGQLTGGLAHDFNNLLAGISGALELMPLRIAQGRISDVEKYVLVAQSAAKRAAALTHRLLAFSRRQTLDPIPTDLHALALGMSELIQRTVGPSIHVNTISAEDLWPVCVDAGQLENALLNLCINSRDAMPEGGTITIETGNYWGYRDARLDLDSEGREYVYLHVSDTGTGMSPDIIAKAFDPFFTTKPTGQGTGLGLSMIYGFVKQSSGHVRIASTVGSGTNVCIYLPRYHGPLENVEVQTQAGQIEAVDAGETILVVDDEATVRMLVSEVLTEVGYTVIEAADSVAGLKILQSDVDIDLLVTDVGLPGGMNGRQMADAGREKRPGLKTLFITGYAEKAAMGHGQLPSGMQVMTKPFSMDSLVLRVRELSERDA